MSSAAVPRPMDGLTQALAEISRDIDALFDDLLPVPEDCSAPLFEAIRHAAIGGGKRLRPLLACASAEMFGVPRERGLRAGLAVECIHVHSLIHDDLPCMDDDDMRRGKPSVHVAFDEATAVLAGDSLLALAFEVVADPRTHPDGERRAELAVELARAAGPAGMAGGQMLDLSLSGPTDIEAVARLQRLKTGALIAWSVDAGAILGGASSQARRSLRGYAQSVGLAFQIADDLLDHGGDEAKAGKRLRKDEEQGKTNYVILLGADGARQQAEALVEQALDHLRSVDAGSPSLLAEIARFAVARDR